MFSMYDLNFNMYIGVFLQNKSSPAELQLSVKKLEF